MTIHQYRQNIWQNCLNCGAPIYGLKTKQFCGARENPEHPHACKEQYRYQQRKRDNEALQETDTNED